MTEPFKLRILFGDAPDRPPVEIAPGWEMAEIPVALLVKPFESAANWSRQRQEIASWSQMPTIKASSHFLQFWGLTPVGPGVDWDQLEFWTKRAFARLAGLDVEVVGVYGSFLRVPEDFSKTKAMDQAIRFVGSGPTRPAGSKVALKWYRVSAPFRADFQVLGGCVSLPGSRVGTQVCRRVCTKEKGVSPYEQAQ